ncbi:MAG: pyrroline-5-carboxylate reductase [Pseudomonadota bacterium]|nr:pyrroline-5-carboxylate reductase [Pseudomonadota bacterium]
MSTAFIGGGNMAGALIGGLVGRGVAPDAIRVVEPSSGQRQVLESRYPGLQVGSCVDEVGDLARSELIVMAVKPQQMRDALRPLVPLLGVSQPVIVTIAAGVRLETIHRWLDGYGRVVRAMPNTPALIGQGLAGAYAPPAVDAAGRKLAEDVLRAGGDVIWLDDEAQLDAVTGVSGSGPAYVFYFLEAIERAARELGFTDAVARQFAYKTFSGAIALAQASEHSPSTLRAQVTSKGGTTERGLQVLEQAQVADSIVMAVKAATERARELGAAPADQEHG